MGGYYNPYTSAGFSAAHMAAAAAAAAAQQTGQVNYPNHPNSDSGEKVECEWVTIFSSGQFCCPNIIKAVIWLVRVFAYLCII